VANFNVDDYVPVQDRINQFWSDYPEGRVLTELAGMGEGWCCYKALLYANRDDRMPISTGFAYETVGKGMVNKQGFHHENAETSAIGRACANLGMATSAKDRPSREEMQRVKDREEQRDDMPERGEDWKALGSLIQHVAKEMDGDMKQNAQAILAVLTGKKETRKGKSGFRPGKTTMADISELVASGILSMTVDMSTHDFVQYVQDAYERGGGTGDFSLTLDVQ
jgi:hypothetical protein